MLVEAGHRMAVYDPFFEPDARALDRTYDFITCSETAEHFHDPAAEFRRLNAMLRPGGWLAVMTSFQPDGGKLANWRYLRDPTHVVLYCEETLRWIAARHDWSCTFPVRDIALMQRSA